MQAPKRVRYFHGMLLGPEDFQAEQQYHREKRRLLNRSLHGYGTVCGLLVVPADPSRPARVIVEPGLAIDSTGQEIVVPESQELDLAPSQEEEEKTQMRGEPGRLFVTLEYDEKEVDPVPGYGHCGDEPPEASRIEESFHLSLRRGPVAVERSRDELLEAMAEVSREGATSEALRRVLAQRACRPCPSVPRDRALTLASVDPGPGPVLREHIDNVTHRPTVLSSASVLGAL